MKGQKEKDADLFSQLPLLIFTKDANISVGHCTFKLLKIILKYFTLFTVCFSFVFNFEYDFQ